MPLDPSDLQRITALIDERVEPVRIQRVEFEEVKAAIRQLQVEIAQLSREVAKLVQAQKRTDEQIAELAQAQRRTEKALAEQGERMERGFAELRAQMAEMRAQMAERDERMERGFAESRAQMAEMRTQMAERDERMERESKEFRTAITDLRKEVGALGEAYGLDLEDVARYVVPLYLREVEGYEVGELESAYLRVDGEEIEVDLHGTVRRGGQTMTVVGEVKSRMQPHEMEALVARNAPIEAGRPGPYLWVLFTRRIHPQALQLARERGMLLVPWDYQYARRPR